MPYFTDFAENAYADKMRGQGIDLPAANWYIAYATAADDDSFSEIVHVSMPRVAVPRSLAGWAGTQGEGTTGASSGTSHVTSNNADITHAAPSVTLATANAVLVFDALSGGNCWAYQPIAPKALTSGVAPVIEAGSLTWTMGDPAFVTDFGANTLIDEMWRGQDFTWTAELEWALFTVNPTAAGGGTEVAATGGYARAILECSLAELSGTQGPGTTSASTGTDGRISNNNALAHPAPTGTWGDITGAGAYDLDGNLWFFGTLPTQSIVNGSPAPTYAPDKLGIRLL